MTSYLLQVPQGVVGDVTRPDETNVEPISMASSGAPQAYGVPIKLDASGNALAIVSGDAATVFYGILTRQAPAEGATTETGQFGNGVPNPAQLQGVMIRGYASVLCTVGTPVRGGAVYMCTNTAGGAIGDLQATSSGNNVLITGAYWAISGKDSNNITEIRLYH